MRRLSLIALAMGLALAVAPARAQQGSPVAQAGEIFVVPEAQRGTPLFLKRGAAFIVTLDDKMRMASFRGLPKDAERKAEPGTLLFSVSDDDGSTMMTVVSRLDYAIMYGAAIGDPRSGDLRSTSVCPVPAGLTVFEMWPEEFFAVGLMKFEAAKDGDMSCRDILRN